MRGWVGKGEGEDVDDSIPFAFSVDQHTPYTMHRITKIAP